MSDILNDMSDEEKEVLAVLNELLDSTDDRPAKIKVACEKMWDIMRASNMDAALDAQDDY